MDMTLYIFIAVARVITSPYMFRLSLNAVRSRLGNESNESTILYQNGCHQMLRNGYAVYTSHAYAYLCSTIIY